MEAVYYMERFDKIIIGAGLYGLYSALFVQSEVNMSLCWSAIQHLLGGQPILIRQGCIRDIIIQGLFLQQ